MSLPMRDTEYGTKWNDFLRIIDELGFKIVLRDGFDGRYSESDEPQPEEIIVAYDEKRGALISATSYIGDLNGGHVYAEVEIPDGMTWHERSGYLGGYSGGVCSPEGVKPVRLAVDWDVRYSLAGTMRAIDNSPIRWVKKWTKRDRKRHIWLVDYQQEHESENHPDKYSDGGYFDRCRNERAARIPAEIREAIGY